MYLLYKVKVSILLQYSTTGRAGGSVGNLETF